MNAFDERKLSGLCGVGSMFASWLQLLSLLAGMEELLDRGFEMRIGRIFLLVKLSSIKWDLVNGLFVK